MLVAEATASEGNGRTSDQLGSSVLRNWTRVGNTVDDGQVGKQGEDEDVENMWASAGSHSTHRRLVGCEAVSELVESSAVDVGGGNVATHHEAKIGVAINNFEGRPRAVGGVRPRGELTPAAGGDAFGLVVVDAQPGSGGEEVDGLHAPCEDFDRVGPDSDVVHVRIHIDAGDGVKPSDQHIHTYGEDPRGEGAPLLDP